MSRLFFLCYLFISSVAFGKHLRLTLQDALNGKLVKGSARSLGGYQGSCAGITLTNLTKDSLIILVEPGRRLNSTNDAQQDLLVVQGQLIAMRSLETKNAVLKAYCCQATRSAPQKNATYGLGTLADSALVILAQALDTSALDNFMIQHAVWAISDLRPTAAIGAAGESGAQPLMCLVAALKREPIPWYRLLTRTHVYSSGEMQTVPLLLTGDIPYRSDSLVYATCYLLDEREMPVGRINGKWMNKDSPGFAMEIPVKGITAGRYSVVLTAGKKVLVKLPVEI